MGFWGINEFNKSLIGKHYLRLMEVENSLVGRVLKGRYFPRTQWTKAVVDMPQAMLGGVF